MSHSSDQFFEHRVNAADSDNDATEAYYRQKEIDEAEEAEYKAMCDADEAACDWLDAELELLGINTPPPDFTGWLSNYNDPDYLKKAEAAYKEFEDANNALTLAVEKLRAMNDFMTPKTDAA